MLAHLKTINEQADSKTCYEEISIPVELIEVEFFRLCSEVQSSEVSVEGGGES